MDVKIPKVVTENALNSFTNSVTKALKRGDKLTLTGFGTFSVAKRRARTGRNPQTGKEIKIPATKVAKWVHDKFMGKYSSRDSILPEIFPAITENATP
jgi:DNA-binding protein HU-beta